uniref:Uncharacterized protein n=1 Tax=Homo sapiens TaxID=9606 RepID=A0A0G2JND7_HUMAN|nr:LOC100129636 [Homo sapiens]UQL50453.1 LOC100129636 [Homo sapiens]UQL50610.1 LOC100129636 [Homo sapiens]UQL50751.1 LOC100129636 [Homo sapiens]UQL50916.1 LOC100129636 [Homo sapiens]
MEGALADMKFYFIQILEKLSEAMSVLPEDMRIMPDLCGLTLEHSVLEAGKFKIKVPANFITWCPIMAHSFTQQPLPASKPQDTDLHQHMGQHYLPNSVEKRTFHHWVMRVDSDSWLLNARHDWRPFIVLLEKSMKKL